MNRLFVTGTLLILSFTTLFSQLNPYSSGFLRANNIMAYFNANGTLFSKNDSLPGFIVPKDSLSKSTIYTAALWFGGIDANNNLHLSAQTFRNDSIADFWPGPLSPGGTIDEYTSEDWDKVWKVYAEDIYYHLNDYYNQNNATIIKWPAKGNVDAKGAFNRSIIVPDTRTSAPFVDVDSSGDYNASVPVYSDYPPIKGDEMLWYVYNDDLRPHTETGAAPVKAHVKTTAYAIASETDVFLNNTVIVEYEMYYYGFKELFDFNIGVFADFDIGCWDNDYIGCDTLSNTFFAYNAVYPETNCGNFGYGNMKPIQLVTFLDKKMDRFISINNNGSVTGYPTNAAHYFNYLNGKWKNSANTTYGGDGYAGQVPYKYMYDGNPSNAGKWSQCSANTAPNDRRGLGVINIDTLRPGYIHRFALAFSFVDYQGDYPCFDFETIRPNIESLKNKYNNNLLANEVDMPTSVKDISKTNLQLYPNPTSNYISFQIPDDITITTSNIAVYDLMGKKYENLLVKIDGSKAIVDVSSTPAGNYYLEIINSEISKTYKFQVIK